MVLEPEAFGRPSGKDCLSQKPEPELNKTEREPEMGTKP